MLAIYWYSECTLELGTSIFLTDCTSLDCGPRLFCGPQCVSTFSILSVAKHINIKTHIETVNSSKLRCYLLYKYADTQQYHILAKDRHNFKYCRNKQNCFEKGPNYFLLIPCLSE